MTKVFKSNIVKHEKFNDSQLEILFRTVDRLDNIINSLKFKNQIINYYCPLTDKNEFIENNGHDNKEIYNMLSHGAEFSLSLDHDNEQSGVIGYTYPGNSTIYTYSWWFDKYGDKLYPAHLAHEWCHKLGFEHSIARTQERKFTVPYAVHSIVEQLS